MWWLLGCTLLQGPNTKKEVSTQTESIEHVLTPPQIPSKGLEFSSVYSKILIQDEGSVRSLYFVRDSGEIVLETAIDLQKKESLQVPYTKGMFVSHAFIPKIESSLLIGLGGGAMIHFIDHHWPDQKMIAVDIDPVIVDIAKNYFAVPNNEKIALYAEDGFVFIKKAKKNNITYNVIYMDAFLKPSSDTDSTGVPLRLKTLAFYDELQSILKPNGIVVFNINYHKDINTDLEHILESFEQVWKLAVPDRGNIIVVATTNKTDRTTLSNRATQIDKEKGIGIGEWVDRLQEWSIEN